MAIGRYSSALKFVRLYERSNPAVGASTPTSVPRMQPLIAKGVVLRLGLRRKAVVIVTERPFRGGSRTQCCRNDRVPITPYDGSRVVLIGDG
jgi:hypothetical protein